MHKFSPQKFLIFLLLLSLSGCGRADISEERKNYILANEHGWIELSVDIASQLINQTSSNCMLEAFINGERFLTEPLFPAGASEKSIKTGFLFAIPSAKSEVVLNYSQCQKEPHQTSVPLELPVGTLVRLQFDGRAISASAPTPYNPVTLGDLAKKIEVIETSQNQYKVIITGELSLMFKVLIAATILLGGLLIIGLLKYAKRQA